MNDTLAYGVQSASSPIEPLTIRRRKVTEQDIAIDILYCGICHSDLHSARNDWGGSNYPLVPGHEIIGKVREVGSGVTRYQAGDIVGVGCLVDSCQHCGSCEEKLEQYCENGMILTYNSEYPRHNEMTMGGYSKHIVVDEKFVFSIPQNLDLSAVAPLLCAGITTWSPLKNWQVAKGDKVGIIGLGGLGHMGVKLACALGAEVTMITTSASKGEDAQKLGAHHVLLSTDANAMEQHANHFDFLLNTIPVHHDMNPYLALLKRDKTMVLVGVLTPFSDGELHGRNLVFQRKSLAGSLIGGTQETQEMLDFCGEHQVLPEVEIIKPNEINQAFERMLKNDVKYRFVIDFT